MKALDILEKCKTHFFTQAKIDEAISELEELMRPKSCDGCAYGLGIYLPNPCLKCARFTQLEDKYEPKEQL